MTRSGVDVRGTCGLQRGALQRVIARNGVPIYRSELLHAAGFRHAFSTRHGGVSAAPFDSMNLGVAQAPGAPDTQENIARNAALLLAAAEAPNAVLYRVKQVHGAHVHAVERCVAQQCAAPSVEADAVVSVDRMMAPCVRTADCVPILMACTRTGRVAAVHAGWRGLVANVIARAVEHLVAQGADATSMIAAIGPCIGRQKCEVGPEVAEQFVDAGLSRHVISVAHSQRPHVDCFGAARRQLQDSGVPAEHIDGEELCTIAAHVPGSAPPVREFFSYRHDGARSGRMAAVIVPATER